MVAMIALPTIFMNMGVGKPTNLAVVDQTGAILPGLSRALADTAQTGQRLYTLVDEPARGRDEGALVHDLGAEVTEKKIGGFFLIPPDAVEKGEIHYYSSNVSDFRLVHKFDSAVERAVREARIERSRLDTASVSFIMRETRFTTFKVQGTGEARKDEGVTFGVAYIMGFILYFILVIYGGMVLRAALEEKTSRSAEVMVATVRTLQLMGGKILGVGAAGLTQVAIWAVAAGFLSLYGASLTKSLFGTAVDMSRIGITPGVLLLAVVYFLGGFLFYSSIFGAAGAMVSTDADAQQMQLPLNLPLILSFMLMFLAIRDPGGTISRVASMIPFSAPIVMMARVCVVTPPAWEIAASLLILFASTWGAIWIAARIFRVGILMYGKRPDLPELIKWIRYG